MARGVPCHLAPLPPPAAHPLGAQILEIAIPSPTEKTKNRRRKARQTGHTQTGHCMPPKRRREDAAEGQGRKTRSRAGTGRRESDSGGAKAHRLRLPKARIRGVPLRAAAVAQGGGDQVTSATRACAHTIMRIHIQCTSVNMHMRMHMYMTRALSRMLTNVHAEQDSAVPPLKEGDLFTCKTVPRLVPFYKQTLNKLACA